ncbi:MAG: tetratricopeptide repeat protein [Bacteroidales bacterium]|nr:tetratricopeptide repeat protein [Bacteroidales bacterium]MCF8458036.1 tetratricopeptide repeat protein [Bacteroidales bacterium]
MVETVFPFSKNEGAAKSESHWKNSPAYKSFGNLVSWIKNKQVTVSLLLVLIIVSIAFYPSLQNNFTNWDDDLNVLENQHIKELSWENVKAWFTQDFVNHYVPLVMVSYSLEYKFFGLDPFAYHTVNLLLHLLNCCLVFWFIYLLWPKPGVAFITALLFGIHPLHIESVAWISERKDVLYAFFFLFSLIAYMYYKKQDRRVFYYGSIGLFLCSLLTKSMAVTLPFVLLLIDYPIKGFNKKWVQEKIPYLLLSVVFALITLKITYGNSSGLENQYPSFSLLRNFLVANYGIVFYLQKIFLPINLSAFYPYPADLGSTIPKIFFLSPVIVIALVVGLYFVKKHTTGILFGGLFFVITIFPVLQLIPAGNAITADRYPYIPSIGIFFIVGVFLYRLWNMNSIHIKAIRLIAIVPMLAITCLLVAQTRQRCLVWKDGISLWSDVTSKYPDVDFAHHNLGNAYLDAGLFNESISSFNETLRINPKYLDSYISKGFALQKMGMLDKAMGEFEKVLKIDPDNYEAYVNLGISYFAKGFLDQALIEYSKAIEINPENENAYFLLGLVYLKMNDLNRAIIQWNNTLRINPKHEKAKEYLEKITSFKKN